MTLMFVAAKPDREGDATLEDKGRRAFAGVMLAALATAWGSPTRAASALLLQRNFLSVNARSGDLAPASITWDGRLARVSGGMTSFAGLDHGLMLSPDGKVLRVELENSASDRRSVDRPQTRRSEVSFSDARCVNGQEYWMAVSILPSAYTQPDSLRTITGAGGAILQLHADDTASPSFALRRTPDDRLAVTATGGRLRGAGPTYWVGPWALDVPHHFVIRFVLDPTDGELDVWMDGAAILNRRRIPLGLMAAGRGSFVKMGCYYAGGLGPSPEAAVVNAFANYVPPQSEGLIALVRNPPPWPGG